MPSKKQQLLDQIAADIVRDNICPDLAKTATHLVPGEGNPDADIVLIGEAPGKNEDLTGKPFVGAAGKFLTELLANAGLTRDEVFITSIVKYRPPNNRDPKPDEKEASWPYLLRQLEVIKPKLVVTLGRHSMGYFVPNVTIGQVHGTLIKGDAWDIMPVYHPAAALYSGATRALVIEDFMKLKEIVKTLKGKHSNNES
ncbi:MAG TPA: uracil-DNA glycosylase [Nitrosospira sp.]|jgi:DNA polymerase|nr:uracil-DNA glycosylase [Nitrosospira sp.]